MQNFAYHNPGSVADAVAALKGADDGKFLAGGQSFVPVLRLGLAEPSDVINLKGLADLQGITDGGDHVAIGALATHAEVETSSVVRAALPGLATMAGHIGDPQVRNRGTLGGSVAHADPAADYPAALIALKATVVTDRREIAADDFFRGLFETALEEDEVITQVKFPKADKAAYGKFASTASKYALVGVFVAKHGSEVRVAVTGASARYFRVAAMEQALAAKWSPDAVDGIIVPEDDLQSDMEADSAYRAHLVSVMAKRAVGSAG
ncbi:MAG: xanthine dehydrogenase family protein subunit M [Myxococcota bacterium]